MSRFSEVREFYRIMGPLRFTIFFGGLTAILIGLASIDIWLEHKTGWPDAYGFHCRGRGCGLKSLPYSLELLKRGGYLELLLFAWLWFLPAVGAVGASAGGVVLVRRWLKYRRNRIRPLDT